MEVNFIDKKFWKGKKIFITGHNGFVGSWLCCALEALNVKKITLLEEVVSVTSKAYISSNSSIVDELNNTITYSGNVKVKIENE